jgi:uncharacterized protein (TIGR02284 family)
MRQLHESSGLILPQTNLAALHAAISVYYAWTICALRLDHMAQKKEIISTINDLIETLKDGEEGFRQAAEAVKNQQLKAVFSDYSQQRSRFANELQSQAESLGETEPEESSSATGAMHRAWIGLKSALTRGDEHAILAECERGEDSAVDEYKKALESDLSPSLRDVLARQYGDVKAAHDQIKNLRDTTKRS